MWRGLLIAAAALLFAGCSATQRVTNSDHTATEQLLQTTAVDRAVSKLVWPPLEGKAVVVRVALPTVKDIPEYMQRAVEVALAQAGARVVDDPKDADYAANILGGAMGTDESDLLVGLPAMTSILLPITTPELSLYKSSSQLGFAKLEVVMMDRRRGGVIAQTGPAQAETYDTRRQVLFIGWHSTDTSRDSK